MRTFSIICVGAIALLAMEVCYSFEIQKFETYGLSRKGIATPGFFCGPVTATLKSILNLDAPPTPTSIRSI
jgi:hypothetical protein